MTERRYLANLWDGIRNGINHAFIPNIIKVSNNRVQFSFFVSHDKPSYITKSKDEVITIHINSIQLYHILKQAIDKYKSKLETDDNLQRNFIDGWESKQKPHIKTHDPLIRTEVRYLLKKLRHSDQSNLFV